MASLTPFLSSPREAHKAFQTPPKQRNLFLVRFFQNGSQTGADQNTLQAVTYVAKMVDRPKITPKVEELHQYNKKRQIYTGFKLESVRVQLYDDHSNAGMSMVQDYLRYYFGDFQQNVATSYAYDVISSTFKNNGTGFGFTASATSGDGDFYFNRVEIYHFYHDLYDAYQLINPRISVIDPEDLDYENANVSVISLTLVYEDLQFFLQRNVNQGDATNQEFPEFASGAIFDGQALQIPDLPTDPDDSSAPSQSSSAIDVNRLLTTSSGALSPVADYRYNNAPTGGSLGMFGSFVFGSTSQQNLTSLAAGNSGLAAALDLGSNISPMSLTNGSVQGAFNTAAQRGINGAAYDVALGQAMAATSMYGNATDTVTTALLTSNAITGSSGITATSSGVTLSPESYGTINAQQSGTAQYGFLDEVPIDTSAVLV